MAELYVPPSNQRRTIIVVTASNDRQAAAVEAELAARRQSGCFGPDVLLFAVPDPSSARVGSGGATFNALMTVQELVSSSLDIENCLVICIHSGGDSQRMYTQSVCGKAWSSLPSLAPGEAELDAPVDLLLRCMLRMFADVPSGLVVASSDVLLLIPESFYPAPGRPSHWAPTGATGLAIPTEAALGPNHGVYHVEGAGVGGGSVSRVKKFFQKASVPEMRAAGAVRGDDKVLIDTGVIYFSPPATSALLTLARTHPLDSCTYQGLDCGRPALRIELYSDIMMAMDGGLGLTFDEYCAVASSETKAKELAAAREVMWRHLRTAPFFAAVVEGGDFAHVGTTLEYLQLLTDPTPVQANYGLATHAAWYSEGEAVAGVTGSVPPPPTRPAVCVQNSLFTTPGHISPGSVVEHSALSGEWRIGSGCLVSSVRTLPYLTVRDGIAVQEVSIPERGGRAVTVLACKDPIKDACNKPSARVCGVSWGTLWGALGLSEEAGRVAVWGDEAGNPGACTLWNARLWAVTASSRGDSPIAATLNLGIDGVAAAGGGGSKGGSPSPSSSVVPPGALTVDPVSADRIALWLQWLGVPTSGPEASAAAASLGLTLDQFLHTRAAHTQPSVTSQWLSAPRLCLRDILGAGDASLEFSWRRELRGNIDVALLVASIAKDSQGCIAELVRRLGHGATPSATRTEGAAGTALHSSQHANSPGHTFARLALSRLDSIASTAPPNIAGRALSVQSALLWAMAGWGVHGHRSGPAYNAAWLPALALLDGDAHAGGRGGAQGGRGSPRGQAIAQLAVLREAWSHRAHLTGRAARHYERAAQLLTAQCVYTAPVAPPKMAPTLPPMGHWTNATAPVRIDLAGGWSDTPPLTYEAGSGAPAAAAAVSALAAGGGAPTTVSQCATLGGGLVVNAGVLVDGVKSLGARVRRVPRTDATTPLILVRQRGPSPNAALLDLARSQSDSGYSHGGSSPAAAAAAAGGMAFSAMHAESGGAPGVVNSTESITALKDLGDYNQPHAASALVKCALLCLGFVKLPQQGGGGGSDAATAIPDLGAQLAILCGGESVCLEVETWSLVPLGSGLGTSSILASTVLAALSTALGRTYTNPDLNHLVLIVEQMLTTGGGWQDQVGGLWPGVKASWCAPALPVEVRVMPLCGGGTTTAVTTATSFSPPSLCDKLDAHLFLVYTGKTRLAKHLLQRVLRQWAVRENGITSTVDNLRRTAAAMAQALAGEDLVAAGKALSQYWGQKKLMAPLAEPVEVTYMLEALGPHILGASLCGAGGGGFLVGISKVPGAVKDGSLLKAILEDPRCKDLEVSVHRCTVDREGLTYPS